MLSEKILAAATTYLEKRKIKDLVIGLALIACELDNGDVGVSYVLREGLARGCSRFPKLQSLIGGSALKAAELAITGTDNIQRGVAVGVLTAASHQLDIPDDNGQLPFGLEVRPEDKIAMIGHILKVANQLSKVVENLVIFDKGLSQEGNHSFIKPMERQAELLPTCDIVLISGTSIINTSIDSLLGMCVNAHEIVLMGPSTPMFPDGYIGTKVTRLAGSFWSKENKPEIFKAISLAGGIASIEKYMLKKMVKTN